jgi:hypothetical protein
LYFITWMKKWKFSKKNTKNLQFFLRSSKIFRAINYYGGNK